MQYSKLWSAIINMKSAVVFAFLFLFSSLSFAQAKPLPFVEMLNAIDTIPTRVQMESQWKDSILRLKKAGCNKNLNPYARSRAISLLSMFSNDGLGALESLSKCEISETKERAIYTMARTFPTNKTVIALVLNFDHGKAQSDSLWSLRAMRWINTKDVKLKLETLALSPKVKISSLAKHILVKKENP